MEWRDERQTEPRWLRIGAIARGVVVWTRREGDTVRIISARFASRIERALYEEYVRIQSRVLAAVHEFASQTYYPLAFRTAALGEIIVACHAVPEAAASDRVAP